MTVFLTPKMALNWACEILETALPCFTIYVIQFSNTKFHACHISWFFMIFDWRDFLWFSRLLTFSKNHFLDSFEIFRKLKWFSRCQKLHSKVAIDYFGLLNCGFLWLTIHNRPKPDLPTWSEHIATLWLHFNGESDHIQHKTDLSFAFCIICIPLLEGYLKEISWSKILNRSAIIMTFSNFYYEIRKFAVKSINNFKTLKVNSNSITRVQSKPIHKNTILVITWRFQNDEEPSSLLDTSPKLNGHL